MAGGDGGADVDAAAQAFTAKVFGMIAGGVSGQDSSSRRRVRDRSRAASWRYEPGSTSAMWRSGWRQ
jgi:hypothetical protein